MNSIIQDFNKAARAVFGRDLIVMLARCPAFGHSDCCVIFSGAKHQEAAKAFLTKVANAKHTTNRNEFDGVVFESSAVVWAA